MTPGMGGVPDCTSYELHLPAEMSAWYSLVELQWTVGGRLADACLRAALARHGGGVRSIPLRATSRTLFEHPGADLYASAASEGDHQPNGRGAAVEVTAAQDLSVQLACRVLEVSESGYYARRSRAPSLRSIRHVWLTGVFGEVHPAPRGTYGIRRVHADL